MVKRRACGLGPDLAQRLAERRLAPRARPAPRRRLPRSTPQTASSVRTKAHAHDAAGDRDQPRRRERVEQAAGDAGGDGDAGDHHQPDDGRGRRAALRRRRAWPAAPGARCRPRRRRGRSAGRPATASAMPRRGLRRHPGRGHRGQRRRPCQHRHAADDPGRAPAADDRSRSPGAGAAPARRSAARPARRAASPAAPARPPSRGSGSRWSAPRSRRAPVCTRPSRTMPSQPSGGGGHGRRKASCTAQAAVSMPST